MTDANAGVHISHDNGLTWQQSNTEIDAVGCAADDSVPIFSLTVDPHNIQIIWVGTDMSDLPPENWFKTNVRIESNKRRREWQNGFNG